MFSPDVREMAETHQKRGKGAKFASMGLLEYRAVCDVCLPRAENVNGLGICARPKFDNDEVNHQYNRRLLQARNSIPRRYIVYNLVQLYEIVIYHIYDMLYM